MVSQNCSVRSGSSSFSSYIIGMLKGLNLCCFKIACIVDISVPTAAAIAFLDCLSWTAMVPKTWIWSSSVLPNGRTDLGAYFTLKVVIVVKFCERHMSLRDTGKTCLNNFAALS